MVYRDQLDSLPNAAPEWQARCLGWLSRELVVACPLEGLVGQGLRITFMCTDESCRRKKVMAAVAQGILQDE